MCRITFDLCGKKFNLPESGYSGEVVMDVEHGGIQERVDVVEALETSLQAPPALLLQLPQLRIGHAGQGGGRRRHRGH